jgi:hypothetical protein
MRANGWDSPSVLRRTGSSAFVFRLGHFRYERPWLKDERRSYLSHISLVAKATPHTPICKACSGDGEGGTISG